MESIHFPTFHDGYIHDELFCERDRFQKIQINGSLTDHSLGVSDINYTVDADNPGIVTINVRANRLSASKNNTFSDETTEKHKIEKVYVNDWIAWENGTAIQPKAAQIYNTIHPYVGSMSDNGKTLTALGINDVLPIATHELQTTDEPYGWTMNLDGSFKKSQQTELERTMKNYAMVILVCTENLGSVTFSYSLDGQKQILLTQKNKAKRTSVALVHTSAILPPNFRRFLPKPVF